MSEIVPFPTTTTDNETHNAIHFEEKGVVYRRAVDPLTSIVPRITLVGTKIYTARLRVHTDAHLIMHQLD